MCSMPPVDSSKPFANPIDRILSKASGPVHWFPSLARLLVQLMEASSQVSVQLTKLLLPHNSVSRL